MRKGPNVNQSKSTFIDPTLLFIIIYYYYY